MRFILIAFCILFSLAPALGQAQWQVANASVKFIIKNAGLSVDGTFEKMSAVVLFDETNISQASILGQVEVGSINTGISMRDRHLKKSEYFYEEKFPTIFIKSNALEAKGSQQFAGQFMLTMRGISKNIDIPFTFMTKGNNANLLGQFTIDRRDFKVGGSSFLMADNVKVVIELKLKKAS